MAHDNVAALEPFRYCVRLESECPFCLRPLFFVIAVEAMQHLGQVGIGPGQTDTELAIWVDDLDLKIHPVLQNIGIAQCCPVARHPVLVAQPDIWAAAIRIHTWNLDIIVLRRLGAETPHFRTGHTTEGSHLVVVSRRVQALPQLPQHEAHHTCLTRAHHSSAVRSSEVC